MIDGAGGGAGAGLGAGAGAGVGAGGAAQAIIPNKSITNISPVIKFFIFMRHPLFLIRTLLYYNADEIKRLDQKFTVSF